MEGSIECFDTLICSGARRLTGYQRRLFMAEVTTELCKGSARQVERRFGWGRETVLKGLHESRQGIRCLENFAARGRLRSEREGPATGCGYPCDRRASYLRRSATEVVATVHEPVGSGGARGLDRHGPSLRKGCNYWVGVTQLSVFCRRAVGLPASRGSSRRHSTRH